MTAQPTRDQLRALANAATPGPWVVTRCEPCAERGREDIQIWDERGYIPIAHWMDEVDPDAGEDAEFIAAARTAVPQLLDQLDQAEAERDWNLRSSRIAKKGRIEANARAERAEQRIRDLTQEVRDERAACLDQMEQVRIRDARIKAVEDALDTYAYTGIYTGQERVAVSDIRRALESDPPPIA